MEVAAHRVVVGASEVAAHRVVVVRPAAVDRQAGAENTEVSSQLGATGQKDGCAF